ncbi:MAG: hypothetical protein K9W44_01720 [Candidatus Lokiarchaeota archaeon]|nr:hypothetical protein [Candidatus Harpocratesius repetitus]
MKNITFIEKLQNFKKSDIIEFTSIFRMYQSIGLIKPALQTINLIFTKIEEGLLPKSWIDIELLKSFGVYSRYLKLISKYILSEDPFSKFDEEDAKIIQKKLNEKGAPIKEELKLNKVKNENRVIFDFQVSKKK